jgi:hypothetical protein
LTIYILKRKSDKKQVGRFVSLTALIRHLESIGFDNSTTVELLRDEQTEKYLLEVIHE